MTTQSTWENDFINQDFSQDWEMAHAYLDDYLDYGKLRDFITNLLIEEKRKVLEEVLTIEQVGLHGIDEWAIPVKSIKALQDNETKD